jgi:hypothetical protein
MNENKISYLPFRVNLNPKKADKPWTSIPQSNIFYRLDHEEIAWILDLKNETELIEKIRKEVKEELNSYTCEEQPVENIIEEVIEEVIEGHKKDKYRIEEKNNSLPICSAYGCIAQDLCYGGFEDANAFTILLPCINDIKAGDIIGNVTGNIFEIKEETERIVSFKRGSFLLKYKFDKTKTLYQYQASHKDLIQSNIFQDYAISGGFINKTLEELFF